MKAKILVGIVVFFIVGLVLGIFIASYTGIASTLSSGASGSTSSLLEKIKSRGKLIVGTSADWPPYEYVTSDGGFAGIDIALAKKIAEALEVQLEIKDMKFAALFEAVKRGDVDIVIADVNMKPERLTVIDFSIPYRCESGKAIVIREDDASTYTGYDWLKGKKIGVQLGTTEQDLANQYFGNTSEIITFDRVYPEMTMALKSGHIDAMIVAPNVAKIITTKEEGLKIIDHLPFFSCSAVVIPKGADDLKVFVSEVIWHLKESGELDKIIEKEVAKWLETG